MALADLVRFTDQSFLVLLDCAYLISHFDDFLQDWLLDVRGCLNQRLQPERLLCPRLPLYDIYLWALVLRVSLIAALPTLA